VRGRTVLWAGIIAGWALLALNSAVLQPWTLDDAYITMRYADHLAGGHGPVYNLGERVEGYTCFLWMVLLAAGRAVGAQTEAWSKVLGLVLAGGTIVAVGWIGARWSSARTGGAAALILGGSTVFTTWAMSGMEVPLVAAMITLTAAAALDSHGGPRAGWIAGVGAALALLVRPDSAVAVLSVLAGGALAHRDGRGVRALFAISAIYLPYFLWRWAWYGWLLPNTFYAKVGATEAQVSRGLDYAVGFVGATPGLSLAALVGLVLAVRGREWAWVACGAAVALHGAYVVSVGGDVMPAYRFFAGLLPLLALVAARALDPMDPRVALGAVLVLVGSAQGLGYTHPDLYGRVQNGNVGRNGREVGLWLAANLPPDTRIATNTAGSVPYFSGLPTIDMLGLNDATIAHTPAPRLGTGKAGHERANGAYVLDRRPDVVLLGAARGSRRAVFRSDRQLVADPRFSEDYAVRTAALPSGAELTVWLRRDRADLAAAFAPTRARRRGRRE
jgi:arabinofuranosyltransferase